MATFFSRAYALAHGLGAAFALTALTLAVVYVPEPANSLQSIASYRVQPFWSWLTFLGWVALVWLRSVRMTTPRRELYALTLLGFVGALAPLLSKFAMHVSCPALALALAYVLWPLLADPSRRLLDRVPRWRLVSTAPVLVFSSVFVVVFIQSYRRHLWFGSAGKDLGLFHQSIWLLSRFKAPNNTIMGMHAFADHLEFIDFLVAPLMWLWPSPGALLAFQAVCVALGAVAVFDLARRKLGSAVLGVLLMFAYVAAIDLQNAVMFDWNPTTCGAGLLPWIVWCYEHDRPRTFAVAIILVALTKENLVLYALTLCLVLGWERPRRRAWVAAAALFVFFVVEMKVIFPAFRPEGFRHLRYEELGSSGGEILFTVITKPWYALSLLASPQSKVDGLLAPLSTVAFVGLLAPRWLLALVPMTLERFWSTHTNRYWGYHYGAGAGVLAIVAAIMGLAALRAWLPEEKRRTVLGMAALTVAFSALLVSARLRGGPPPLFVWRQGYYTAPQDRVDAEAVLVAIPKDASVAAQNHLIPHLSARAEIYELHKPITANFVAMHFNQGPWPFDKKYLETLSRELLNQGFGVVACRGDALVLQRGATSIACPRVGVSGAL